MYQIVISRIAEKQLATFPKSIANSIAAKIDALATDPRPNGCKNLKGVSGNIEYVPAIIELFTE